MYVQDQYEKLPFSGPVSKKLELFTSAWAHKVSGNVLINFASGTSIKFYGVYIQQPLIRKLGQTPGSTRPKNFGWSLFDYEFSAAQTDVYAFINCVQLIVASNFKYEGFEKAYKLVGTSA